MDQAEQRELKDWYEFKLFKDPVYGYIPVNRAYVSKLIDTQMMQRIKGVAQTGLRPVFSSATHDRFSHSLGVYKFGMAMYDSFYSKLESHIQFNCFQRWEIEEEQKKIILNRLNIYLKHWKTLLAIGCLLHDIGHPVQSHGFEFLYDDPYLDVDYEKVNQPVVIGDKIDSKEQNRIFNLLSNLEKEKEKKPEGNLRKALLAAFRKKKDLQEGPVPGNPHERMSAYYILKDKDLEKSITELIKESWEMATAKESNPPENSTDQDICFIARMIIGWEYPVERQLSFDEDVFFLSIRNCIIHILNGELDADGIDYLMRNSYAAGYDTSKVDSNRLCNAYTAYEKNYVIMPAFSKSALSVLEGYMSARNFEPKWLYSHHKVVYADLLTKRVYKYITRYLTDRTMLSQSVKMFFKHARKSALVFNDKQNFGTDLLVLPDKAPVRLSITTLHSHIEQWSYPFYTYLLAPCRRYIIGDHHFCRSADADMESLFHWMLNELKPYNDTDPEKNYSSYTLCLREKVLDDLLTDPSISISEKELRILLAETCCDKIPLSDKNAFFFLKKWAETGNIDEDTLRKSDGPSQSLIENMLNGTANGSIQNMLRYWLNQYQPLLSSLDFAEFINLLGEFQTRCYRRSLWKSLPEYQLFLKDCATQLRISVDDVDRYMVELIENGMRNHGFSIFEGKAVETVPDSYREQFFYQQHEMEDRRSQVASLIGKRGKRSTPVPLMTGKQVAQKWANIIFTKTTDYDFSQTKLVVKYYRIKSKRFNKIKLLFNKQPVPLMDVFPQDNYSNSIFPYFYYQNESNNGESETILKAFQKPFLDYCREYRKSEVRSETIQVRKNQVFRDAIYGDIEMPEKFYAVVRTREFQRLGRIRQLATADRSFPNATHTRLAHSIGTWHVMRLILNHFDQLYNSNPQLQFTQEEEDCALLAALLHDLGHGPYSHAIEEVFNHTLDHEEMTRRIIMDRDTEVWAVIEKEFGAEIPARICELLNGTTFGNNDRGINLIYRTLISSQLDADRIDYLVRDNASCGMSFGHIDIQQLIASMHMLPDYNDKQKGTIYRLCFDDRYLPAIEQFVYARYQMYKNVYHDPKKLLYEQLIKRIFHKAFNLFGEIKQNPIYSILKTIWEGKLPGVSDFISLDDESLNGLIKKWASGDVLNEKDHDQKVCAQAEMVTKLSKAFLNQSLMFEQISLGDQHRQYDLLAKRIGKQLGIECNTFSALDNDCCSFIFISGEGYAYKMHTNEGDKKKNIVLRNLDDGTTIDYMYRSLFRSAVGSTTNTVLKTDYCYLFFSKDLLLDDCLMFGKTEESAMQIRQMVESAKPRKHIEIEKKFYCSKEQLKKAEEYFDKKTGALKIDKLQKDTYYDCKVDGIWILSNNHFSFRCREKNKQYVFTVKIPTNSPNYHSPSQFARHEHEFESSVPYITDEVGQFLINTLDIYGSNDKKALVEWCTKAYHEKTLKDQLVTQLIVENQRITYRFEGKCEVCLDTVDYKTHDQKTVGSQDYQIEIELLSEPEDWSKLETDIIEPLVQKLGEDSLIYTNKSKLEKGLDLLNNSDTK